MSTDNTLLNPGVGGDTIRNIARQNGSVKTQVVQQDIGGGAGNAEILLTAGQKSMAASMPVVMASDQPAFPVTGTFWQSTQPVSIASSVPVTGTFFQTTQPVSAAALPLPAGAATDATVAGTNPYRGTSSYSGGTSGTVAVPAGARIVSISAHATTAGSVAIFAGASVPIPAGNGFSDGWSGLVGPTGGGNIVFTGTDSYYVVINQ